VVQLKELLCIWKELSHSQRTLIKFLQHLKAIAYSRTIRIYIDKEDKQLCITTYKSTFKIERDGKMYRMLFKRTDAFGEVVIDAALVNEESASKLIDFVSNFIEYELFTAKEISIPTYLLDYLA